MVMRNAGVGFTVNTIFNSHRYCLSLTVYIWCIIAFMRSSCTAYGG